jgi:ribonuclease D
MYIEDRAGLRAECERFAREASIGVDMEFVREKTYFARLCLVQVATQEEAVIIDPLAVKDMGPLFEIFADPKVEKIFHAAGQDLEIFHAATGKIPRNIFDTQIAAALVGYGDSIGYGSLLFQVLKVRLPKLETNTDWARRPLSQAQIDYALDDVRYLHRLRDRLVARLAERRRTEWLAEEQAFYEHPQTWERNPRELYLRVSRHRTLDRRGLGILRELAQWREEEARRRDLPRGWVVQDEVLVEIARRAPREPEELKALRGLGAREIERSGKAIVAAVARGRSVPEEDLPPVSAHPGDDRSVAAAVDLLEVFLKARAAEKGIGVSYLGTRRDLAALVLAHRGERPEEEPHLLHGWRRRIAGEDLLAILDGRRALALHPATGALETISRHPSTDGRGPSKTS